MKNIAYLALILFFGIMACKKNGSSAKCKVASLTMVPDPGNPLAVNFTYDDQGNLKFVNNGGSTLEYWFYTNGYRRRSSSGNGWHTYSTVALNANGLPVTKKDSTYNGQSLSNTSITSFEYDGQGQLIKTYKDNDPQPQEIFTWTGGNLVKYQAGNTSYFLEYFTDKPNRDFTFIDLQLYVALGINPARSKNLLKSVTAGGNQMNFQYQYDGGNIKKWFASYTGNPDTVITTTQQFVCD